MNTMSTDITTLRWHRLRRERRHDAAMALVLATLATLVFWLLPTPAQAQDHRFDCDKTAGIENLRCRRHEKMFARCGPLKGEAHFVCDREFLLANPLQCSGLDPADTSRCEAELAAFKSCEVKPGRDFLVCVRETMKASPMGPH